MEVTAGAQLSNTTTQPALGVWFYYYFSPPALLVGLSELSR
jgi:hypothetical protein